MPKKKPKMNDAQLKTVARVMGEWKAGRLHSGGKKGPLVTSYKQAQAIAMSEAGVRRKAPKKGE